MYFMQDCHSLGSKGKTARAACRCPWSFRKGAFKAQFMVWSIWSVWAMLFLPCDSYPSQDLNPWEHLQSQGGGWIKGTSLWLAESRGHRFSVQSWCNLSVVQWTLLLGKCVHRIAQLEWATWRTFSPRALSSNGICPHKVISGPVFQRGLWNGSVDHDGKQDGRTDGTLALSAEFFLQSCFMFGGCPESSGAM